MNDVSDRDVRQRRWTLGRSLAEVALIAIGVFIGLAAEQWRDGREREARAADALRRIRTELAANREEVRRVVDYHLETSSRLKAYFAQPPDQRKSFRMDGILPAQFEHTAWDLAQTTEALADLDPELTFELARVYGVQTRYLGLSQGITNAMYLRPPSENANAFLQSLMLFYGDIVLIEPSLEKLYGDVLPRIDRELER